ncbi:MAG: cytochrome c [Planctomycetes bacterium]|nr:cytochrome c [Planctomycetota bacterium]
MSDEHDEKPNRIGPTIWAMAVIAMAAFVGWKVLGPATQSVVSHAPTMQAPQKTPTISEPVVPPIQMTAQLVRGRRFFEDSCALCHGERGDGNGRLSPGQAPRPRDFRRAKFKFATTDNHVPSDDDLLRLFRSGVTGATMPGFPQAGREDLLAVAAYVRKLVVEGVAAELSHEVSNGTMTTDDARRALASRTTPGPAIVVPPEPPTDEARLENGKRIYLEACVKCHGADGEPDLSLQLFDEDGQRNIPRRFAQGFFKVGEDGPTLYIRTLKGMAGTPMPSFEGAYSPSDIWDVVHYVQLLCRHPRKN